MYFITEFPAGGGGLVTMHFDPKEWAFVLRMSDKDNSPVPTLNHIVIKLHDANTVMK